MELAKCEYRTRKSDSLHCQLVAEVLGHQHAAALSQVDETTCRVCGDFFPARPDDWNPIVASLLLTAAEKTQNDRLAERAFEELWHAQTGGYLDLDGQLNRNASQLTRCPRHGPAEVAQRAISPSPCLHFVRRHRQLIGTNAHRSGWPFAVRALAELACSEGILFDDFVEQRFCYQVGSPGYREPWIGVFHHPPPQDPHFLGSRFALAPLFETKIWRDTFPFLKGAIALSEHLASYLRDRLQIPVEVVKHPGETERVAQWSERHFSTNRKRQLVQLGWFGRNTQAVYQMSPHPDFTYVRVLPSGRHFESYESRLNPFNAARGLPAAPNPNVVDRTRFSDLELRAAHTSHVFITEMLAASANNAVLDCIASCSPLVINRHPAVVEYLGEGYPLYFDDIRTAHTLLDDDRIISAHRYLRQMDRRWMRAENFRGNVAQAIVSIQQQAAKP